ncbi:MAG: hypothetical protein ACM3W4_04875 [Ignavibacteriales bacterium]
MTILQRRTTVDVLTDATASGDAAQIAAANAMPIWQEDRVIVTGTLGCWDFKSPYCNSGAAITTSTTFANLVRGGSPITVTDATGMTQKLNGSSQLIGVRMTSTSGKMLLPAACKPVAGQGRFGIAIWATLNARDTTKFSSLGGYGYALTTQNAIAIEIPSTGGGTNIVPYIDGNPATGHAYTLGSPFQIAAEYVPNGASSVKNTFWNGAQLVSVTYDNGGSLNIPTQSGFTDFMIGQLGSHDNTGLDWTIHRIVVEDFATSGRTMADLVAASWSAYSTRFS